MTGQDMYYRQLESKCIFNDSYSLSEEDKQINDRITEIIEQLKSYGIDYNNDYEILSLRKDGKFFDYSQDQRIENLYLQLDQLLNGDW